MAGREALFADACVNGHLVEALILRGWDVMRAIDVFPEGTDPRADAAVGGGAG